MYAGGVLMYSSPVPEKDCCFVTAKVYIVHLANDKAFCIIALLISEDSFA